MEKNKKILGFNKKKLGQWLMYWMVVGVGFVALTFVLTSTWIGVSVKEKCSLAKSKYGGSCVEALALTIDDEGNSFSERNQAIWVLGQMGDSRSKWVLEKYYTGKIPEREPYDEELSQYEIKKALKLVDGGTNVTTWIWGRDKIE